MSKARWIAGLGACAVALALTSCSSGSDSASETTAENAEGGAQKVLIYSGRSEELVAPLLEQFTSDTGIEVDVRYAGSGELAAQIITEGAGSPADVFLSQDAGALGAVSKAGLFAPIDAATLQAVPSTYSAADGTWVGVSGRARTIVYNPEMVPTPPNTIDALLDPQWQGQIAYAPSNASWQAFVTGLRVLRGDQGAEDWLRGFQAQNPRPYESNGQIRDAVDAGEIPMGLTNHYYMYELMQSKGAENVAARLQFMAPGDPGGLINVAGVGILKTAPRRSRRTAVRGVPRRAVRAAILRDRNRRVPADRGSRRRRRRPAAGRPAATRGRSVPARRYRGDPADAGGHRPAHRLTG